MASSSSSHFSISQGAQIRSPTWPGRPPRFPRSEKHHKNLHFLSAPTSNSLSSAFLFSSSFPLVPKSPQSPIPFYPLHDTTYDYQLEDRQEVQSCIDFDMRRDSNNRVAQKKTYFHDPPWLSSLLLKDAYKVAGKSLRLELKDIDKRKYNLLRRRQIKEETGAWEKMLNEYGELVKEMCDKKLAPTLPFVKGLFVGWFEPFKEAIEREKQLQRSKFGARRASYAPYIDLLPSDKMALIVMHKMLSLMTAEKVPGCVRVVKAATIVGLAIEEEVKICNLLAKTKTYQSKETVDDQGTLKKERMILRKRINLLIKRKKLVEVQRLVKTEKPEPWHRDAPAKLGSRLIEILMETAYVQPPISQLVDTPPDLQPAFKHRFKRMILKTGERSRYKYGVIECNPLILEGLNKYVKQSFIPYAPMLVPPKKWKGYDKGGHLFLPSFVMRTHGSRIQQDTLKDVPVNSLQKVFEALDTLGSIKWKVNKRVLDVVESMWAAGGNIAGLVNREDVPEPETPLSDDCTEMHMWKLRKWKAWKTNKERHSQRCDMEIKLSVARKLKNEEGFYYPHNLDFRGRAYPLHSHLTHLGSDFCRGILEFAEGRPLGKSGLHWLKIHMANLYGGSIDKLSHDGRLAFVESHLDDIFDSAENPLNGNRWWLTADDPFQFLSACINLSEALKSSSPHSFVSHLPIHQDGSCNGLQHYAALGRNSLEAAAVNLVACEKPADVYSEIALRVHEKMKKDSNGTDSRALLARILIDQVDRRLVKQTVMTSVYGVTFIGAREQITKRLEEKGQITDDVLLYRASCYAAQVTMTVLEQLFGAAREVKSWLSACAQVIISKGQPVRWKTPLRLPVVQPYYKTRKHNIITSLQIMSLNRESSLVDTRKQKAAFPPNFVHSLDGTHMMLTALACRDANIHFAGVHDSFWTHASDVDLMNRILREKFVELYNTPILENLLECFQTTYPTLRFPSIPERGNFDLQEVLKSPYFFN